MQKAIFELFLWNISFLIYIDLSRFSVVRVQEFYEIWGKRFSNCINMIRLYMYE